MLAALSGDQFTRILFSERVMYPLVLHRFSEPVGVVASVAKKPSDLGQAAEQRPRSDVVA